MLKLCYQQFCGSGLLNMNILRRTIFSKLKKILFIVIILISGLTYPWTNKDRIFINRVSNNFAEHLFNFPIPPQTKVIEKNQSNGKYLVAGIYPHWGVIASVKFSTKLSKEEILSYYQNVRLFKYPNSEKRGAEPELYFQGDFKKVEEPEGFYYTDNRGVSREISTYFDKHWKNWGIEFTPEISGEEMEYVVQLTSSFDYGEKDDYID
jgi:hypothetical protein